MTSRYRLHVALHVISCARSRNASARRCAAAALSSVAAIAASIDAAFGSQSKPWMPSSTNSGTPPTRVATTGVRTCAGFQQHNAKWLLVRRQHKTLSVLHPVPYFGLRHVDVALHAHLGGAGGDRRAFGAIAADQHQPDACEPCHALVCVKKHRMLPHGSGEPKDDIVYAGAGMHGPRGDKHKSFHALLLANDTPNRSGLPALNALLGSGSGLLSPYA